MTDRSLPDLPDRTAVAADRIATYAYKAPDRACLVEYARLEIEGACDHYRHALEEIAHQGPHRGVNGKRWRHWSSIAQAALSSVAPDEERRYDAEGRPLCFVCGQTQSAHPGGVECPLGPREERHEG